MKTPSVDSVRHEIDAVDDQIHDLVMRRAELVATIGAAKTTAGGTPASMLRPGREVTVLRRLLGRHRGAFPPAALVRIWRELMAEAVRLQGPFTVAVHAPPGALGYRNLARDHFGSLTELLPFRSASQVLQAIDDGRATVGVLPVPSDSDTDPWWPALIGPAKERPRVIARLPIVARQGRDGVDGFVVARFGRDATDNEISLLGVEAQAETSRDRVKNDLGEVGLEASWIAAGAADSEAKTRLHLISVAGVLEEGDRRLATFRAKAGEALARMAVVGGYAPPLGTDGP